MLDNTTLVLGVSALDDELYFLLEKPPDEAFVELFNATSYTFVRRLKISKLGVSTDLVACERNRCLYISDSEQKSILKSVREQRDKHRQWRLTSSF